MRGASRATLLLVLLLVGCVQAGGAPSVASVPASPSILLRGCTNLSGTFPVPLDQAQALLPPGFTARGSLADGAELYVVAAECASAVVDGVDVGVARVGYAELGVEPPAALKVGDDNVVPVFFVAQPPAVGNAAAALHLGRSGAGSVTREDLPSGGVLFTALLGADGFRLTDHAIPGVRALPAGAYRAFAVQGGELKGVLDGSYSEGSTASGVLTMTPIGQPPLLLTARPAARGGSVSGFDLGLTPAAS